MSVPFYLTLVSMENYLNYSNLENGILFIYVYLDYLWVLKCSFICFNFPQRTKILYSYQRQISFLFFFQHRNVKQKLITEHRYGSLNRKCIVMYAQTCFRSLWLGKQVIVSFSFQPFPRRFSPALLSTSGIIQ